MWQGHQPTGCLQQIEGSIIMGLGHALMEEMIYEDGKLRNGNMVDYKVPTFMDSDVEMKITLVEQAHPEAHTASRASASRAWRPRLRPS